MRKENTLMYAVGWSLILFWLFFNGWGFFDLSPIVGIETGPYPAVLGLIFLEMRRDIYGD